MENHWGRRGCTSEWGAKFLLLTGKYPQSHSGACSFSHLVGVNKMFTTCVRPRSPATDGPRPVQRWECRASGLLCRPRSDLVFSCNKSVLFLWTIAAFTVESSSESLHTEPNREREGLLSSSRHFSQTVYGLSACWDCLWASWMLLSGGHEHATNPKICHKPRFALVVPSSQRERLSFLTGTMHLERLIIKRMHVV